MFGTVRPVHSGASAGESPGLLREREVASLLSVSTGWLRKRRCLRLPPDFVKCGKSVRYTRDAIRRFVEANTRGLAEAA